MPYSDPDDRRAYGREWMKRNPDKAREAMRRWRKRHRELDRAKKRVHYALNREREKARIETYRRANPLVEWLKRQRRRARELGATGTFTRAEWVALIARYGGCCAYCRSSGALQVEHRVALSRGGSNSIDNIVPACGTCNLRKHTLTEEEFRARLAAEAGRLGDTAG